MRYVADTNTFLAVALGEPEKEWLVEVTAECQLIAPAVLPYEIGNALSALVKRKVIGPDQALAVWETVAGIPVELVEFEIHSALRLAARLGLFAYDAYYLQCALETRCSLLTLDQGMQRAARNLGIGLVERS
jgi:predicted nucleic acid-binding protein